MTEFKKNIDGLRLTSDWNGCVCRLKVTNASSETVRVGELEIYDEKMPFSKDTKCYGEGYSMLTQYAGTVSEMKTTGSFSDHGHYGLPQPDGYFQTYNMAVFTPNNGKSVLMGFTSCSRFTGIFRFNETRLKIILNLESIEIKPSETVELESFFLKDGEKNELLRDFGEKIAENHEMPATAEIPTGWCSWMVYGPDVTEKDIVTNLEAMKEKKLGLKYIQIDDGYQPHMGDWLSASDKFWGGMEKLCLTIKNEGFEPAVWVAPFIAEKDSDLFKKHSGWFVKDDNGMPLPSDKYSYGGWRGAPWFMLDTSNPDAREYIRCIFETMRKKWQVKYFKLDANMWGALPFGRRYMKNVTSVEAYRMGMKAIMEGVGDDGFLLGCNAPMCPSLGMVHGMRVTNDNLRSYKRFVQLARECFPRNWQNNRLWINDPDTVLLMDNAAEVITPDGRIEKTAKNVSRDEYMLCAGYILASGGMILSSDNISEMTKRELDVIERMLPPEGTAAEFNDSLDFGVALQSDGTRRMFLFNYGEADKKFSFGLSEGEKLFDFWNGKEEKTSEGEKYEITLKPHTCRVLQTRPIWQKA